MIDFDNKKSGQTPTSMLNIFAGRKLLVYSTNISAIHHTNKIKIATIIRQQRLRFAICF
jgi:hypothetical protein